MGLHPALQTLLPTPSCRPVERVLSAYQFAVDIAAQGVLHLDPAKKTPAKKTPAKKKKTAAKKRAAPKKKKSAVEDAPEG